MNTRLHRFQRLLLLTPLSLFSLLITWSPFAARADTTLITFENIPDYPTPVDDFGSMFPGVVFSSQDQWLASYVNATDFLSISNRCIGTYGISPLVLSFDVPTREISLDIGSGYRFQSQTASIQGFLGGQLVFSQNIATQPTPSGAEEVRAYTHGVVDQLVVFSSSGGFALLVDNLTFTPVPEPSTLSLVLAGGLLSLLRIPRRKHRNENYTEDAT